MDTKRTVREELEERMMLQSMQNMYSSTAVSKKRKSTGPSLTSRMRFEKRKLLRKRQKQARKINRIKSGSSNAKYGNRILHGKRRG